MLTQQERIKNNINTFIEFSLIHFPKRIPSIVEKLITDFTTKNQKQSYHPSTDLISTLNPSDTLQSYADQNHLFAPYSVILGKCEDNLPLTLELTNPAPGSILICGDRDSGKTRLLTAILKSAILLNDSERLRICVISSNPDNYEELQKTPHFVKVLSPEQSAEQELIKNLVEINADRCQNGITDPAIVLAIDDLVTYAETLETNQIADLYRVVRHGPRTRIWTIASLHTIRLNTINKKLLSAFRTRFTGKIASSYLASEFTESDNSPATSLEMGEQFCVPVNQNWLKFSICD